MKAKKVLKIDPVVLDATQAKPKATQAKAKPKATQAKAKPKTTQAKAKPKATQAKAKPAATQAKAKPAATQAKVAQAEPAAQPAGNEIDWIAAGERWMAGESQAAIAQSLGVKTSTLDRQITKRGYTRQKKIDLGYKRTPFNLGGSSLSPPAKPETRTH